MSGVKVNKQCGFQFTSHFYRWKNGEQHVGKLGNLWIILLHCLEGDRWWNTCSKSRKDWPSRPADLVAVDNITPCCVLEAEWKECLQVHFSSSNSSAEPHEGMEIVPQNSTKLITFPLFHFFPPSAHSSCTSDWSEQCLVEGLSGL